jgi:hypothetical protein
MAQATGSNIHCVEEDLMLSFQDKLLQSKLIDSLLSFKLRSHWNLTPPEDPI